MSDPPISIRPLERRDLPAALAIQSATYPAFLLEDEAAFASRLDVAASYCLAGVRGDVLVAYLLAQGWPGREPPSIGTVLEPAITGEALFIHDLAVSSEGRGSGIGSRLVSRAVALAAGDGFRRAELIAVEGAASYWRTLGFTEPAVTPALAAKVAGYGGGARWMERALSGS